MKSKTILSLSIAALIGTTVYIPTSLAASHHQSAKSENALQSKKDGEIIATLVALNNNEITLAQEAKQKATNPAVKRYARMMDKEHTKNLKQTLQLSAKLGIAPVQSKTVSKLQHDGKKELKHLASLDSHNFDKAYSNEMVRDHTAALKIIDQSLKHSSNPEVTAFLNTTRPHIAMHLAKAEKIQQELNNPTVKKSIFSH